MTLFQRWKQTALHNKALVLTGCIVAFGALSQVCIMWESSCQTSRQTQKLIDAANVQTGAAQNFATSAANINTGIGTAVDKLNLQADKLDASAKQAARLADLAQQSIKETREHFVEEQRPYVWFVSNVTQKPILKAGQPIIWTVEEQNYGRSTAFRLHVCVIAVLWSPSTMPSGLKQVPLDQGFKRVIPAPSFSVCQKRANGENRSLEPAGGHGILTAVSNPITESDVELFRSSLGSLDIEAISEYEDIMGNHYTSTFCDMYSPMGANVQCPYYNDMK